MTKKKVFSTTDHAHYWDRQWEMHSGSRQWKNVWVCRWCAVETTTNPFDKAPKPDEQEAAHLQMALHRRIK